MDAHDEHDSAERTTSRLRRLHEAGVSIWLDTLSRELLDSGDFAALIAGDAVTGATSNPTIFAKAITGSSSYDEQLRRAVAAGVDNRRELFFELAFDDVRRAADMLLATHAGSGGRDGFVSFECTPDVADDAAATVAQALELWNRLARRNVMIKVPATDAGIVAIADLTERGVNVNVTLLFSLQRYEQAIDAYLTGLERRVAADLPIASIASVASFFVSRVDARADALLPADSALRGQVAIANAQVAYGRYVERFTSDRWRALRRRGAQPQRPLWASTAPKDPAYSDVVYVERLIARDVVNTMPQATLRAFAEHGDVPASAVIDPAAAEHTLRRAADEGIDLAAITAALERDGVQQFCDSYGALLACIDSKVRTIEGAPAGGAAARSPVAPRVA
jgi:transaldolase